MNNCGLVRRFCHFLRNCSIRGAMREDERGSSGAAHVCHIFVNNVGLNANFQTMTVKGKIVLVNSFLFVFF